MKALYRRAQAYIEEHEYDRAQEDLLLAERLAPEDKSVARLMQVCAKQKKKDDANARKAFGKMFG